MGLSGCGPASDQARVIPVTSAILLMRQKLVNLSGHHMAWPLS